MCVVVAVCSSKMCCSGMCSSGMYVVVVVGVVVICAGFLYVFYSYNPRLFPGFSSHGMTISLTLLKQ